MPDLPLTDAPEFLGNVPDVTVDYLDALLEKERAFIAGGYARDKYHGKAPRDIDYWIEYRVLNVYKDGCADNVQLIMNELIDAGIPFIEHNMYGSHDGRGRLAVYKIPGADLIFVENVESAVNEFDFNLNQFYMEPGVGPIYVGEGDPADGLVQLQFDERCNARLAKMTTLWEQFYGKHETRTYAEL